MGEWTVGYQGEYSNLNGKSEIEPSQHTDKGRIGLKKKDWKLKLWFFTVPDFLKAEVNGSDHLRGKKKQLPFYLVEEKKISEAE